MPRKSLWFAAQALLVAVGAAGCGGPVMTPASDNPASPSRAGAVTQVLVFTDTPEAQAVRGGARAQLEHGRFAEAEPVLRDHLAANPGDREARDLLAFLLINDGRADEAAELWAAGMTGETDADFAAWMKVGKLRLQQVDEGPTVEHRPGSVVYHPSGDATQEEAWTAERITAAEVAFRAALALRPANPDALVALASVALIREDFAAALEQFSAVSARFPERIDAASAVASCLFRLERGDDAVAAFERVVSLDPHSARAYQALASLYRMQGRQADAERSERQAEFYGWVPGFSGLDYDGENHKTYRRLAAHFGEVEGIAAEETEAELQELIRDSSTRSSGFLATFCWHHSHDEAEDRAFEALAKRYPTTADLLLEMIRNTQSTCTVRAAARILARHHDPRAFDLLIALLAGDLRDAFDMDIAGALDLLGDPRAVPHLIAVIGPALDDATDDPTGTGLGGMGREFARARAALALGAFDTPESRATLEACAETADVGPYCRAALYRLTGRPEYLASLRSRLREQGLEQFLLAGYLADRIGTDAARQVLESVAAGTALEAAAIEPIVPATTSPPDVPAPLVPENGGYTGSLHAAATRRALRPLFRWRPPAEPACPRPRYDVQVDDSCTTPGFAECSFDSPEAEGLLLRRTEWRPEGDLAVAEDRPVGRRYYWRVRACCRDDCSTWSSVRYAEVGRVPSDFNGDGYSDLVFGAARALGAGGTGSAFVYAGSPDGPDAAAPLRLDGPDKLADAAFGGRAAWGGDINADGFGDLLVTDRTADDARVFVFLGAVDGPPAAPDSVVEWPVAIGGQFGGPVARAGDIDADGFADVAFGEHQAADDSQAEGSAFLYFGGANGLASTPAQRWDDPEDVRFGGFGGSLTSPGDVNADGFADLVIGAWMLFDSGSVFVFLGGPRPLATQALSRIDHPDHRRNGGFGTALAGGDVNGDGFADLVAGSSMSVYDGSDPTRDDPMNAWVFSGNSEGIVTTPAVVLADPSPAQRMRNGFGSDVAAGGDLDGDGYGDAATATWNHPGERNVQGRVYLYRGSADGLPAAPGVILENPEPARFARFGNRLAIGPDVNGDGYDDLVVGAGGIGYANRDQSNAFVYFGGPGGVTATPDVTIADPRYEHPVTTDDETRVP